MKVRLKKAHFTMLALMAALQMRVVKLVRSTLKATFRSKGAAQCLIERENKQSITL